MLRPMTPPLRRKGNRPKPVPLDSIPKVHMSFGPGGPWHDRISAVPIPVNDSDGFELRVTDDARPRALTFFKALVKRLPCEGIEVEITKGWNPRVIAKHNGIGLRLVVKEILRLQPLTEMNCWGRVRNVWVATGRLAFEARDTEHSYQAGYRIEIAALGPARSWVPRVIKRLKNAFARAKAFQEDLDETHRRYAEEDARRQAAEAARAAERERRNQLVAQAEAWRQRNVLRDYIAAVEDATRHAAANGDAPEELVNWCAWANAVAEDIESGKFIPQKNDRPASGLEQVRQVAQDPAHQAFWTGFQLGRR